MCHTGVVLRKNLRNLGELLRIIAQLVRNLICAIMRNRAMPITRASCALLRIVISRKHFFNFRSLTSLRRCFLVDLHKLHVPGDASPLFGSESGESG